MEAEHYHDLTDRSNRWFTSSDFSGAAANEYMATEQNGIHATSWSEADELSYKIRSTSLSPRHMDANSGAAWGQLSLCGNQRCQLGRIR